MVRKVKRWFRDLFVPKIKLTHIADLRLISFAQGARFSETVLPSGFRVPKASEGKIWVAEGKKLIERKA